MPRTSTQKQAERLITKFFEEAKAGSMSDVMKTRQPPRRQALLAQLDAFDKVEGRYYAWLTSQEAA